MAEESEQPSLHIDTDWKKQAQEEKRRLAEEAAKKAQQGPAPAAIPPVGSADAGGSAPPGAGPASPSRAAGARGSRGERGERAMPPASFAALVQSLLTQVLFYLGDLTPRGAEPQVNLDMAKYNI